MYNESITLYQTYVFFLQKIVLMILLTNTIYNTTNVFGLGEANRAYAKYFIGNSYLTP